MLFLKQFRDIVYADRACYQAIVEAPITAAGTSAASSAEDYELTLEDTGLGAHRPGAWHPDRPERHRAGVSGRARSMEIGDRATPATVISNPYWNPATETATPDEHPRLPEYVERGGEAVWRQPSLLHGARIYGFGIEVPPSTSRRSRTST